MGGLVKKAGLERLHDQNPDALLGALIDAKNMLTTNPQILTKWQEIGKK